MIIKFSLILYLRWVYAGDTPIKQYNNRKWPVNAAAGLRRNCTPINNGLPYQRPSHADGFFFRNGFSLQRSLRGAILIFITSHVLIFVKSIAMLCDLRRSCHIFYKQTISVSHSLMYRQNKRISVTNTSCDTHYITHVTRSSLLLRQSLAPRNKLFDLIIQPYLVLFDLILSRFDLI